MKRKAFIIGALIAVLCIGLAPQADAQRRGYYHRGYGYGYRYHPRPPRVWIAPPPVVVVGPHYGYRRPYYYRHPRPRYYNGYYSGRYGHHRRW